MFNKKQNYFVAPGADKKALSMSDAQALSNLCYQKAKSIETTLKQINNYSKTVDFSLTAGFTPGSFDKALVKVAPKSINDLDIPKLLTSQATYYSFQAFLMEHIKLKDAMIKDIKKKRDHFVAPSITSLGKDFELLPVPSSLPRFGTDESVIWENVPKSEILKYVIADANAAHIGIFIHKGSKLDTLRKELPKLPAYEYESLPDNRTALCLITTHHTTEQLDALHVQLADTHRDNERIVNAINATVKDQFTKLETELSNEHAEKLAAHNLKVSEISAHNQKIQRDYQTYCEKLRAGHVAACNKELDEVVKSKIQVPEAFASIVDELNVKK